MRVLQIIRTGKRIFQIGEDSMGPLHFTPSFQNGQTIQFGILTKYALLQFLCIHCIIIFGNKS